MSIEAMKKALDAFKFLDHRGGLGSDTHTFIKVQIAGLSTAIEQAENEYERGVKAGREQERAMWELARIGQEFEQAEKREWVGLTDDERMQLAVKTGAMSAEWLPFMEAVEAKLKNKNGC